MLFRSGQYSPGTFSSESHPSKGKFLISQEYYATALRTYTLIGTNQTLLRFNRTR